MTHSLGVRTSTIWHQLSIFLKKSFLLFTVLFYHEEVALPVLFLFFPTRDSWYSFNGM